jgi:predicted enzyme related to lactoylglutathione lyase
MPMGAGGDYVLFKVNGQSAAGLMQIDEHFPPDVPSNWSLVLEVADTDAAVAHVQELGGSVVVPPNDIPDVGRFAVVADPWGAVFQVIT